MIDCCPFSVSVLVRLIAHEVSGGWKDYRNSDALKKAEAECVLLRFSWVFRLCNLGISCWKTIVHISCVCECVFVALSK